jgi:hypothetical protein
MGIRGGGVVVLGYLFGSGGRGSQKRPVCAAGDVTVMSEEHELQYKEMEYSRVSDEQWRQLLTTEQYAVTRRKKTERPFSGIYHDFKDEGIYQCVCCGRDLFKSQVNQPKSLKLLFSIII